MSLGDKMFKGMAWSFVERISVQLIQFFLGLVLARILAPEEYGILGILMVFIALSRVFVDSGFSKALIQKKDRNSHDESTVFLFNIVIALFFYGILWIAAPAIGDFYKIQNLPTYLRVLSLILIIDSLFALPATIFTIELDFKSLTKTNLIAVIISGGIAIFMAYNDFGVWALIYQTIIKSLITALALWSMTKWRPIWKFSTDSFKKLFSYGSKLLASSLIANLFSNINALLIGKYIGTKDLGFYSRGVQFANVPFSIFSASISNVLLPGLAPLQDDKTQLKQYARKIIKSAAVITVPAFILLGVLSEPLIMLILTEKWALAIPVMQVFCVARLITIFSGININLLYVIGRTDLVLKQQYLCIGIRVVFVLLALRYGIIYIALAELLATLIHFFINAYYPGKLVGYTSINQIKDLRGITFAGGAMLLTGILISWLTDNYLLQITMTLLLATSMYLFFIRILKIKELSFLISKTKNLFTK